MSKYVLDSSALLALLNEETGSKIVEAILDKSVISAVNFAETINKMIIGGISAQDSAEVVSDIVPNIIPFDKDIAIISGELSPLTKAHGLSLGDRACLATAIALKAEAVTADKAWAKIKTRAKVKIIR